MFGLITNSKLKNWQQVGELSQSYSHIAMKCFHLARTGRLDILCFVNYLARAITAWKKACDKRVETTLSGGKPCIQDADFARDLKVSNQINVRENVAHFRKPHLCSIKLDLQTASAGSHSSTKAQKLSHQSRPEIGRNCCAQFVGHDR